MTSQKTAKGQMKTTDERVRQITAEAVTLTVEAATNLKLPSPESEGSFKIQCFNSVFYALLNTE